MAFFMKIRPLYSAWYLITIFLHLLLLFPLKSSTANVGVTVNLIPRDSPFSPFYDPSKTHFSRLHDAFRRSLKRVYHFKSLLSASESKIQTQIIPGGGEFLMNISIGTPPIEVLGIADTGSDLTWTQCLPCKECYHQKLPLFNPQHSSTYRKIPCQSSPCSALEKATCSSADQNTCEYSYSYGDGSHTSGDLSSETFRLGIEKTVSLRKIVFGCGHDTGGTFDESESGIIGLGGGKLSFISQLNETVGKKFSYCLAPTTTMNVSSKISFGSDAEVSPSGAVTTPLVAKSPDTFYYVTLEGISVGDERIAYRGSTALAPNNANDDHEGNIIIDSGTTLTLLPYEFFDDLIEAVEKAVKGVKVQDPSGLFSLCYKSDGNGLEIPVMTAHFNGGDVKLQPLNTFFKVADDVLCFTMIGTSDVAIYGNLAQMDFTVGFDLEASTVSFLPTDCTKQ